MKKLLWSFVPLAALLAFCPTSLAQAQSDSTRHGPFDLLDSNSKYGSNWFPEPLNSDEADMDQELRINYAYTQKDRSHDHEASLELEKAFGLLTLELEVHYENSVENDDGEREHAQGVGPIELSARHPFFQYVSPDKFLDFTFGGRVELAIPTGAEVSKNTELVGGIFETIGLGDHFNIQISTGYSTLYGPNDDGGTRVLENAVVFGYNIDLNSGPIVRLTPIFELDSETALNKGASGDTGITGVVGLNVAFDSIPGGQPKFIIGYQFPFDSEERDDMHWGIVCSLLLEY